MENLFVPIIVNDSVNVTRNSLFCVSCKKFDNRDKSKFNGVDERILNKKLKSHFVSDTFSFDILETGKNKEDGTFEDFSESTASISLGVFCSAYATMYNLSFKKKYDSITVTGDFSVQDGKIFLSEVTDIKEKYKAVQDYASKNTDKQHLFIYVSSEEMILGGWHDNVFVIPVSQKDKIECVFAEIFEPTDVQNHCIQSLPQNGKGYIETAAFIKWKKEVVQNDCNGFLLHGASQSGKSIAAVNLCKYLIATTTVEEVIWITISDNNSFWDKLHKGLFPDYSQILKEEFPEQFKSLDRFLGENKNCCLIFDNIEGDFTDKILSSIKNEKKYKSAIEKKILKIVITTWKNSEDKSIQQDLQMQEKNCETLVKTQEELKHIVYSAFENAEAAPFGLRDFKENQNRLLEMLYGLCFEEEKSFPGRLSISVASIMDKGIAPYIERYSKEDFEKLTKMTRQFRIDFECLDPMSQFVLFAFLGINKFKNEIDIQKICEIINKQIFNGAAFVSEQNIIDSVNNLIRKGWIHENKPNTKIFYVKTDIIDYCVFSAYEKNEIAKNLAFTRDILISADVKIDYAIQNDLYDVFRSLMNGYDNKEKINSHLIQCIKYNRTIKYFKNINIDKKDVEAQNKRNEVSPLDMFWIYNTNLDVLKFLIDLGYRLRKELFIQGIMNKKTKVGVSPLFLSCLNFDPTKNNFEIIKYALEKHFFEDINKLEFEGWSAIHICALFSNNPEILQMLLKFEETDMNTITSRGETLLHLAAKNENSTIIEYILGEHICDIEKKDNAGYTALQLVCLFGKNSEVVRLLLDYKANRNVLSSTGETLLHLATRNKDSSMLEYILKEHIYNDIEEKDNDGYTALQLACRIGENSESVRLLLDNKANRNVITAKGRTLLHLAAKNENSTIIEYILREHIYNAIDEKDNAGWTALHLACRCAKNVEPIHFLFEYSANESVVTSDGWAVLPLMAINKNSAILKYALKNHCYTSIDECGENGNTALFQAQTLDSFKLLLEHGADPKLVTSKGNNILHAAALFKRKEILEYILKNLPMVDPAQKNLEGKTAAELTTDDEIKKLLGK